MKDLEAGNAVKPKNSIVATSLNWPKQGLTEQPNVDKSFQQQFFKNPKEKKEVLHLKDSDMSVWLSTYWHDQTQAGKQTGVNTKLIKTQSVSGVSTKWAENKAKTGRPDYDQ